MSAYVVGITGGIGSGKSTVAERFVALGAGLVDTDAIAHELTAPGGAAMPAIAEAFGAGCVDAQGALDRAAMRARVFAEPQARRQLEGILHPLIRALSLERCRAAEAPYVLLAVPLLVESGSYRERCQRVLVVDCPESVQIERVVARSGLMPTQVEAIMAVQATRAQRLAIADDVIDNSQGLATLDAQIAALHARYLLLSSEKT